MMNRTRPRTARRIVDPVLSGLVSMWPVNALAVSQLQVLIWALPSDPSRSPETHPLAVRRRLPASTVSEAGLTT